MSAAEATTPGTGSGIPRLVRGLIALVMSVALIGALALLGGTSLEQSYAVRIYPGVHIGNFDVGNLTQAEAAQVVKDFYARTLAVFDFEGTKWFAPWDEIGVTANGQEAARQAFLIGRDGPVDDRFGTYQARQPIVVSFAYDEAKARAYLEQHRAELYIAPRDADVRVAAGLATAVPPVPGRELDIGATLPGLFARVLKSEAVPVRTRAIPASLSDVSDPVDQLNTWLGRPFALRLWWDNAVVLRTISPQERAGWVQVSRREGGFDTRLDPQGVRDVLIRVNDELGPEAGMRLDEAAALTFHAFEQGDAAVWFVVPRRELRYTVGMTDTFEGVGDRYGIPVSRILSANPDIWANGGFAAGQQITIPAQSIMLPVTISPTNRQRIEVNLTTQQLFAFDGPTVVLSTAISSGIPKWRTLVGVFQVQEKVDDAYNKLAHIHMPNWLSIYDVGDPGNSLTNGIHALPVLGGGRRLWAGYLGHPVSFGCIVMGIEDSDRLYKWAQLGTPVIVYGKTPPSSLNYDDLIEAQKKTESPPAAEPTSTPAP
jgi:hypothetical protein